MAVDSVSKRLSMKRAEFLNCGAKPNLQNYLSGALGALPTIGARRESPFGADEYHRLILTHQKHKGMLCGVVAAYERGAAQMTIALNDKAHTLAIETILPPDDDSGRRMQFLEGTCYFGIKDNLVVLCQSQAVRGRQIEHHLNWLIGHAKQWANESSVALSDHVSSVTAARIRSTGVKEIRIGAPLFAAEVRAPGTKTETEKFTIRSAAADAIKALLGDQGDSLQFKDAIDGKLEVELRVKFKRKTGHQAQKLLQNIALAARNMDGEDVAIQLNGGDVVKGQELKHTRVVVVEARDRIPSQAALFDEMHRWLKDGLESGAIDP